MNIRICLCGALLCMLIAQASYAGGGARIIIRQHSGHGFGTGPVANWLMQEGDMVLRSQFGGNNNSNTAGLPPASRAPSRDSQMQSLLDRLDKLNGVTQPTNGTNPVFSAPPISSDKPGVDALPKVTTDQPDKIPE